MGMVIPKKPRLMRSFVIHRIGIVKASIADQRPFALTDVLHIEWLIKTMSRVGFCLKGFARSDCIDRRGLFHALAEITLSGIFAHLNVIKSKYNSCDNGGPLPKVFEYKTSFGNLFDAIKASQAAFLYQQIG